MPTSGAPSTVAVSTIRLPPGLKPIDAAWRPSCVVQVKGKVRARLEVPADISEDDLRAQALALPRIADETPNGVRTVIVRAPKLVNVVPA